VPVEEWLPFLAPVVGLYVYGRRRERRRRAAVGRLPQAAGALDEATVARVLAQWSAARHVELGPEHLPLLYPPGPDGMSASELALRAGTEVAGVERLLEQLEEHEYLELEDRPGFEGRRAWLTFKGYEVVDLTETALLAAVETPSRTERP
jgi:hypothetical protein